MINHKQGRGFTLIELVVVIVILGILAAIAIPQYFNLRSDARRASMQGLAGALSGAMELVHSKYVVDGTNPANVVAANGQSVAVTTANGFAQGYPTAQGILNAVTPVIGETQSSSTAAFWAEVDGSAVPPSTTFRFTTDDASAPLCVVTYIAGNSTTSPIIQTFLDDC